MNRKIPTLNKPICLQLLFQKILGRFYEHVNTAVLTQEWAAKKTTTVIPCILKFISIYSKMLIINIASNRIS